jgi:periplasmic protein CpxP/Spy
METETKIETQHSRPVSRPRFSRRLMGGLAAVVVGGALSLSAAYAHPGGPGGGDAMSEGGGGFVAYRMQKQLDHVGATDAQKSQIKAIWEGVRPQLKAAREQHQALREQIKQALIAPTIDPAAIEKLRQQSVQSLDKTSSLFTSAFVSTAKVLTPEQRKQVAAEMDKAREEHHQGRFGQGGPQE